MNRTIYQLHSRDCLKEKIKIDWLFDLENPFKKKDISVRKKENSTKKGETLYAERSRKERRRLKIIFGTDGLHSSKRSNKPKSHILRRNK